MEAPTGRGTDRGRCAFDGESIKNNSRKKKCYETKTLTSHSNQKGPWAGEGVNLALEDALKLSEAIISSYSSSTDSLDDKKEKTTANLAHKVQAFEQEMFVRATQTQQMTWTMMEAMFLTPGAPRSSIERYVLTAVVGGSSSGIGSWLAGWVLAPVVYTWFYFFKMIW